MRCWVWILFPVLLWFVPFPVFGENAWEILQGPVIKVEAIIRPYVSVSVSLADEKGNPLVGREPVVLFECDRGPGTYRAKDFLSLSVVTNTPLQVLCEATSLGSGEGEGTATLPPERLSVALFEEGKEPETFLRFEKGKKLILFETPVGGVTYTALCAFQLDVVREDRAGTYEGRIVVEAFYRP